MNFGFFLAIIILLSTFRDPEFHHVWFLEGIGEIRPKNENEKEDEEERKKKKGGSQETRSSIGTF